MNEGIIVLSGGVKDFFGGLYKLNKINDLEKVISSIHEKYKDRFYLEIQRHNDEHETDFENFLLKISLKKKIPIIASQEVYYINKNGRGSMHNPSVIKVISDKAEIN